MVIGVQMMSSCESDGKRLEQPGGAPPKEGSILTRGQKLEKSPVARGLPLESGGRPSLNILYY
jgi:hypothetical protein